MYSFSALYAIMKNYINPLLIYYAICDVDVAIICKLIIRPINKNSPVERHTSASSAERVHDNG